MKNPRTISSPQGENSRLQDLKRNQKTSGDFKDIMRFSRLHS
jgi:hypothetical protein